MTTLTTVPGLTEALAETLQALELVAAPANLIDLAATMESPLITADLGPQGTANPEVVVAVRDDIGEDGEKLLDAITGAIAGSLSANTAPPVGKVTDLLDRFDVPTSAIRIDKDGTPVAVIVTGGDRRSAGDSPGPGGGSSAPSLSVSAPVKNAGIEMLRNVELSVSVELGRTSMTLSEVVGLDIGSVIELDRATGSPVDVRVNGTLLARGEVVVVDDEYAVRLTEIIDPAQEGN